MTITGARGEGRVAYARKLYLPIGVLLAVITAAAIAIGYKSIVGQIHFQDDAYYYLVIANNLVSHGLSSFDGIHYTNGYHPLWMVLLYLLFVLMGPHAQPAQQVLAVASLEQSLYVTSVVMCLVFALRLASRRTAIGVGFVFVAIWLVSPAHGIFSQGMETTLATLLLIGLLFCISERYLRVAGLLMGLLALARLDTAVFIGLPLVVWTFAQRKAPWLKLRCILPFGALLACYMLSNFITTGHAEPISGALKSSFPAIHWQGGFLREPLLLAQRFGWTTLLLTANIIFVIGALIVSALGLVLGAKGGNGSHAARTAWIISLLLVLNLLAFQRWTKSIDPRYFALPTVAAIFSAGYAIARIVLDPRRTPLYIFVKGVFGFVLAMTVLVAPAYALRAASKLAVVPGADREISRMRAIGALLPAGSIIAGTDVGALSFWSGHRVINLDGLVNDWDYQRVIRDKGLKQYLHAEGVSYIATPIVSRWPAYTTRPIEPMYRQAIDPAAVAGLAYPPHAFYVYSYLYGVYSDSVLLPMQDEVFRDHVGSDGYMDIVYVVYHLR